MHKKITLIYFALLFFSSTGTFAQSPECGFDDFNEKKIQSKKEYKKGTKTSNDITYQKTIAPNSSSPTPELTTNGAGVIYTIPVVVHVMHVPGQSVGTGSNITDAQVIDGIAHLNDAFRNVGSYAGGPFYTNSGISSADVEIEFCLAVRDPSGNSTSGINRISTAYSNIDRDDPCTPPSGSDTQDDCMKALSFWDSNDYMNVWLVNEICTSAGVGCGVAGYAYTAGAHGQLYDGVVNEASYWGSSENNSKVHVHEVGHYLNLQHTFRNECTETDCLLDGDFVCDTPPDAGTIAVSCASGNTINTCSNDATINNSPFITDVEDIYEDYMDYGFQSCQNTFTPGQVTRMRFALTTTRASLLSSTGCTPAAAPISNFTSDLTSGCEGITITFQDNSANGTTSWSWTFPGGTPSSSTDQNPAISYNTTGSYDVILIASNSSGTGSTETKTDFITIYDEPIAQCIIPPSNGNTSGNSFAFGIFNVTLEGINNSTSGTVDQGAIYLDYACTEVITLVRNTSYNLTITSGPVNHENIRAYIDFNNNGVFTDAGEEIFTANNILGVPTTQSFIASGFATGEVLLTMRVVSDFAGAATPTSCLEPTYGQVEDYGIYFASALPIELLSFTGNQQNESILTNWKTASEENNDFFTLEHSLDGYEFEFLGEMDGKGNSTITNDYRFVHLDPTVGTNYYRLSQTDFDGTSKVADVIAVDFKSDKVVAIVVPNPIRQNEVNLQYISPQNSEVEIEVIDMTGKVLIQTTVSVLEGENNIQLPAQNWSSGIYYLRTIQNQTIESIKFVKTN